MKKQSLKIESKSYIQHDDQGDDQSDNGRVREVHGEHGEVQEDGGDQGDAQDEGVRDGARGEGGDNHGDEGVHDGQSKHDGAKGGGGEDCIHQAINGIQSEEVDLDLDQPIHKDTAWFSHMLVITVKGSPYTRENG